MIREDIKALAEKFQIEEIGFDEDNAVQLATQLENEGLKMVTVPQRMSSLNAPMKELEKMVAAARSSMTIILCCVGT